MQNHSERAFICLLDCVILYQDYYFYDFLVKFSIIDEDDKNFAKNYSRYLRILKIPKIFMKLYMYIF